MAAVQAKIGELTTEYPYYRSELLVFQKNGTYGPRAPGNMLRAGSLSAFFQALTSACNR
jgi:hypothetical protein